MAENHPYQHRVPTKLVNVLHLTPGTQVRLVGGATAEVVTNPQDGVWLLLRYLSSTANPTLVGTEDMVFAEDVLDVLEEQGP